MAEIRKDNLDFFKNFPDPLNKTFFLPLNAQELAIVAVVSKRLNELALVALNQRADQCFTYLGTLDTDLGYSKYGGSAKTFKNLLSWVETHRSGLLTDLHAHIYAHQIDLFCILRSVPIPNLHHSSCLRFALNSHNFGGTVTMLISSLVKWHDAGTEVEPYSLKQVMHQLLNTREIPYLRQLLHSGRNQAHNKSTFKLLCREHPSFEKYTDIFNKKPN